MEEQKPEGRLEQHLVGIMGRFVGVKVPADADNAWERTEWFYQPFIPSAGLLPFPHWNRLLDIRWVTGYPIFIYPN